MAIIVKTITADSNYMTLRNTGSDAIVINKIEPPASVYEGFLLHIEFDEATKGDGIFLRNKYPADSAGNLHLEALTMVGASGQYAMLSRVTQNSGTETYKHIIGHMLDALAAIAASENTDRDNAISAAVAAYVPEYYEMEQGRRTGTFAYGLGGATFNAGFARKQTLSGIDYFDYSFKHPYVVLMWNGSGWEQVSLSVNAVS